MPRKSKRTAARQAQLSGRSKRVHPHGPMGIPAATNKSESDSALGAQTNFEERAASAGVPARSSATGFSWAATSASSQYRGRGQQAAPIETYFTPEIRRIGFTTGIIVILMVVLFFVLR